jgi:hypothetical protein
LRNAFPRSSMPQRHTWHKSAARIGARRSFNLTAKLSTSLQTHCAEQDQIREHLRWPVSSPEDKLVTITVVRVWSRSRVVVLLAEPHKVWVAAHRASQKRSVHMGSARCTEVFKVLWMPLIMPCSRKSLGECQERRADALSLKVRQFTTLTNRLPRSNVTVTASSTLQRVSFDLSQC